MDARQQAILLALTRAYIETAEPIGSRTLSRHALAGLSAATIRNVMSDLEELGYLEQPHTSAGRMPTDKAYRLYVESAPAVRPTPTVGSAASQAGPRPPAPPGPAGIEGVMARTSAELADRTSMASVLLAPPLKHARVARVRLVGLAEGQALLAVVTDSGWVAARAIAVDAAWRGEELERAARALSGRFSGRTVADVAAMEEIPADPLDELHTRYRAVTAEVVALLQDRTLYVRGLAHLLAQPEFAEGPTARDLILAFEQRERLADLLAARAGQPGLQVTIGSEHPWASIHGCAVVTAPYTYRRQTLGVLGVVGPRRLAYPGVMAAVAEAAEHVSTALDGARQEVFLPA